MTPTGADTVSVPAAPSRGTIPFARIAIGLVALLALVLIGL